MFVEGWNSSIGLPIAILFNFVLILISVVLTVHILLHKSDPKSSLMWIALVWFAPVFGAIFYLLFGINRISRRAERLQHWEKVGGTKPEHLAELPLSKTPWDEFRRLVYNVTGLAQSQDNDIQIMEGVDQIHASMLSAIDNAENTIALSTYIFRRNDLGKLVANALVKADERGVDVKVLLDGVGNGFLRSKTYRQLKSGGVDVERFLHSFWPWHIPLLNLRNHRKILIVDNKIGFAGSMNLGRVKNLETQFKISGPVISQLTEAFNRDWSFAGGESLPICFFSPVESPKGNVIARGVESGPIYKRERLRWIMLGALGTASEKIRIVTPYFIPDRGLLSGLVIAALKGVKVEIILPKKSNYWFADWASNHQIQDLLRAGCQIYHRSDVFDHSKLITVDGLWALIGSSNWDARSLRLNFEFDIECESLEFAEKLDQIIDERRSRSLKMNIEDINRRSLFHKLRDSCARLLLPYL